MNCNLKPGWQVKFATITVGLIVTSLGCSAHFSSVAVTLFKQPDFYNYCISNFENCPTRSMGMETFFVAITIICLLLSAGNLIAGFIKAISSEGLTRLMAMDIGYHCLASFLILIAGSVLIRSALDLDKFAEELVTVISQQSRSGFPPNSLIYNISQALLPKHLSGGNFDETLELARNELKYAEKIAAGVMAILNGLLYFTTAGIVFWHYLSIYRPTTATPSGSELELNSSGLTETSETSQT